MLTIIRGLPGSGKSTLAHTIASLTGGPEGIVVEADDYFYREDGYYDFDPSKLKEAHADCLSRATHWISRGRNVVVSNTFTQRWEYQPYLDMARKYGALVQVIEVHADFGSIHNVPDEAIARMRARWEPHK